MDKLEEIEEELFPYDSFRTSQKEGIPKVYENVKDNGYVILEGACGTGKTLLSLLPLIKLVKEKDNKFNKILVLTSVKQQKHVFEDEINAINKETDYDLDSISISGKSELCTYVDEDTIEPWDIHNKCTYLRDNTFELGNYSKLVDKATSKDIENTTPSYPFNADNIPEEDNKQYCPFYANYLDEKEDGEMDISFLDRNTVVDEEKFLEESSSRGLCPHAIMTSSIDSSDIIIANYNHIFDEKTVKSLTKEYINEETLVVFDEAQNMVPSLRNVMSESINLQDLNKALNEINIVYESLKFSKEEVYEFKKFLNGDEIDNDEFDVDKFKKELNEYKKNVNIYNYENYSYIDIIEKCLEYVSNSPAGDRKKARESYEFLNSLFRSIKRKIRNEVDINNIEDGDVVPLRDINKIEQDNLKQWFELRGYDDINNILSSLIIMSYCKKDLDKEYSKNGSKDKYFSEDIPLFIRKWFDVNDETYFKYVRLNENYKDEDDLFKDYNISLNMFNCLPKDKISNKLEKLGGGVIMSATLSPIDVFIEETGLDSISKDIKSLRYPLKFPKSNRLTLGGKLPKFNYSNKGRRYKDGKINIDGVRGEYLEVIYDLIVSSEGNIMIVMPSYSEAEWLNDILKVHTDINSDKLVLDKSVSMKEEKQNIKNDFFEKGKKILITTANGVLVEGIDYKGEKLKNVIVCGVPIKDVTSPLQRAIKTSYEYEFGNDKAFDYSFTIPAVRKVRQSIGRVIRKDTDKGTRILLDKRYCYKKNKDGVKQYLSDQEQKELNVFDDYDKIISNVESFWN